MVLIDYDYTYADNKKHAEKMARQVHSGARKFIVHVVKKPIYGRFPKPGTYKIESHY